VQGKSPLSTEALPSPDLTAEEEARARRLARRAAAAEATGASEQAVSGTVTTPQGTTDANAAASDAKRAVLESAGEALESLRKPNPAVPDSSGTPRAIPQIPGNPYDSEDATETAAP
jgi:hypothetical protein